MSRKKSKPHAAQVASQRNAGALAASTRGLSRVLGKNPRAYDRKTGRHVPSGD